MAYKKIVVPLDGSKLAETVLPHVQEIAIGCQVSEIMLVTVTESMKVQVPRSEPVEHVPARQLQGMTTISIGYSGRIYLADSAPLMKVPVMVGRMAKAGQQYLIRIAEQLEKKGLKPTIAVLIGNVAEEIVHFAAEEKADLIVMASHGRSGISHWAIGSVAEKVFRATDVPVLLVKPKPGFKETKPRRKGKPV